ncbi:hypothetical protein CDO22_08615 [Sinorhizobium meliloti]|uniref:hypothetical protein n=1 Tax=Rhizobium meliloti TaxID=382 RepID=UPI000B49BCAB|nr:hypothetical protein [Sinorhizobium meliloti]ASQ10219.1 hypothetical protein CDO22_08615 [Sinorhizobium meliloti]MQU85689.1 hypothetical protein [Sinorhizobium meliloti]
MPVGTPVLATPAVGATATSATTTSFTPAAGDLLLAFAAARAAAAEIPTISDTLGNTWTQVATGTDFSNITAKLWYQVVEGSPAARTVTASSTGATQVGLAVVSIPGAGTDFSNFQIGTNGAGDPSVTMAAYAASSIAIGFYAGNAGGSNPTIPTGYTSLTNSQIATNIRFAVVHDTTSPSTSMAWVGPSTDSICFGVEIKEAAAGAYTLTANTAAVTLTGTSATLRVDRKLTANTAEITLTGSAATLRRGFTLAANTNAVAVSGQQATLTYTPVAGAYTLTAESPAITLTGSAATLTYTSSRQPEVNWPGTNIPRSKFREMQRAALARYLHDERERLQKEDEKPAQRKVKRAVARVIRRIEGEGLLTSDQIHEAAPAIKQAITSNVSIPAILDQLRLSELTFIAEQSLLDDEAAAILLLAA